MGRYLLKRFFFAFVVLFAVSVILEQTLCGERVVGFYEMVNPADK